MRLFDEEAFEDLVEHANARHDIVKLTHSLGMQISEFLGHNGQHDWNLHFHPLLYVHAPELPSIQQLSSASSFAPTSWRTDWQSCLRAIVLDRTTKPS